MNEPKLTPAAERLNSATEGGTESDKEWDCTHCGGQFETFDEFMNHDCGETESDIGQPESHLSVALRIGPELEKAQARVNELEAQLATINDPTFDATDAAHPAWWRGHDYTAEKVKEKVAGLQAQLTGATARADREAEMRHRYERENERLCGQVDDAVAQLAEATRRIELSEKHRVEQCEDSDAVEHALRVERAEAKRLLIKAEARESRLREAVETQEGVIEGLMGKRDRLRELVTALEWIPTGDGWLECPWCNNLWHSDSEKNGHKPDCPRQLALAPEKEKK